jgi:hypothetical protein
MIDDAEEVARDFGLLGKRRWDLAQSDYGLRVAERWLRSEQSSVDPDIEWCGARGWPQARPRTIIDYSTPDQPGTQSLRGRSVSFTPSDDLVIDLATPAARKAASKGHPILMERAPWTQLRTPMIVSGIERRNA